MTYFSNKILALFFSCVLSFTFIAQSIPYRAVNLGNWLVIEGWMKPSLFAKIPNNDLLVRSGAQLTADYTGSSWNDSDPSVFKMSIVRTLQGEYQITNGYSPNRAPQVLRALDNAFTWAQKYGMKVIVDLHAVRGSQNGNEHSGTGDGFPEWGNSYIPDTVAIIDFLAAWSDVPNGISTGRSQDLVVARQLLHWKIPLASPIRCPNLKVLNEFLDEISHTLLQPDVPLDRVSGIQTNMKKIVNHKGNCNKFQLIQFAIFNELCRKKGKASVILFVGQGMVSCCD
ncbi:hypothetical protein LWI28_007598 [Acer negundo]|uniref:Uncharacterized protein n=1 Tax=Acer negundo TaxID=4023 RepID=A0AAD5NJ23_ACENE|nr:hypothetical protein LWI28_007598 [Acer negundo]